MPVRGIAGFMHGNEGSLKETITSSPIRIEPATAISTDGSGWDRNGIIGKTMGTGSIVTGFSSTRFVTGIPI